jgi:hypothetical protein
LYEVWMRWEETGRQRDRQESIEAGGRDAILRSSAAALAPTNHAPAGADAGQIFIEIQSFLGAKAIIRVHLSPYTSRATALGNGCFLKLLAGRKRKKYRTRACQ